MNKELLNIIDEIYSESNKIMIIKEENIIKKWISKFNQLRDTKLKEKKDIEAKKKEKDKLDYYKFLTNICIKESDFRKNGKKKLISEYKKIQKSLAAQFKDDVSLPPPTIVNQEITTIERFYGKNSIFKNHPEYGIISLPLCVVTPNAKDSVYTFVTENHDDYTIIWEYDTKEKVYYATLVYKENIASDYVYEEVYKTTIKMQ